MSSTLAAQQKVSRTAYDCAAVRAAVFAWTDCPSFDYLAADMVGGSAASPRARLGVALTKLGIKKLTQVLVSRASPGSDVFMFARQVVPDDLARAALAANPETQIVILGAGLDTSGLRIGAERSMAGQTPGRFFEVDLPATQTEKRQSVARLLRRWPRLKEDNILYVPCSFGEDELGRALCVAGFQAAQPTVWVWSGVVHYLTDEAVRATIAELKRLSIPGSQIFFDFILLEAYEQPGKYGFAGTKARFDKFGEVMSFGFREGTAHVSEWLASLGLTFVRSYTHLDMTALFEQKTGKQAPSQGTPWANLCVATF
jgi:methyltransferase (TIGR00027 family)